MIFLRYEVVKFSKSILEHHVQEVVVRVFVAKIESRHLSISVSVVEVELWVSVGEVDLVLCPFFPSTFPSLLRLSLE